MKPQKPLADEGNAMNDLAGERRAPRIPCDLPLEYEIMGLGLRDGRITNLGTTGALLTTEDPVPLGTEMVLNFRLPLTDRPLRTACKVKWVGVRSVGVLFAHLNFQEKDEIWRFYARDSSKKRQARS
jgi:hypothetical protein